MENSQRTIYENHSQRMFFCILSALFSSSQAANWAQSSGYIDQNVVFPYIPSPATKHWGARYGMTTIVKPTTQNADGNLVLGTVYVTGGDTYDGDPLQADMQLPGTMDIKWGNGYKNDVWSMQGTDWSVQGDIRIRNNYKQKKPRASSLLKWTQLTPGLIPKPGQTYDEYLICQAVFANVVKLQTARAQQCLNATEDLKVQWSPRRHHASVYHNGLLWVMGGRAREFVELPESRSIGGIVGPRFKDVGDLPGMSNQKFTTQREASVYKSDVWSSPDGIHWLLVTPGCHAPQANLIALGNPHEKKSGIEAFACKTDADCYGAESCLLNTCTCSMWSPREQHAAASYGSYMYVSGGYASRLFSDWSNCGPYACGDTDASAYRYYLSDVWKSTDGATWTAVVVSGAYGTLGRGGHQMLTIPDFTGVPYLWVFGGRGGDNTGINPNVTHFNDMWSSPLGANEPNIWTLRTTFGGKGGGYLNATLANRYSMPWAPRTGHTVTLDPASSLNQNTRTLFLVGGHGPYPGAPPYTPSANYSQGTEYFDDVWTWNIDAANETWRQDFTPREIYGSGTGVSFRYNASSPSVNYISPDSNLSYLQRYWLPDDLNSDGITLQKVKYLSDHNIKLMADLGIYTVRDLATADKYSILKLRGFDFPQVALTDRLKFYTVCDVRALAAAVVSKCSVNIPENLYDGYKNEPWNAGNVFNGLAPVHQSIAWHGVADTPPSIDDPVTLTTNWDGCTITPSIQGLHGPNVNGLGYVSQVSATRNPQPELEELTCKQTPGPRAYHGAAAFEGRVYLLGGKTADTTFKADTWYRDSYFPTSIFNKVPTDRTSESLFEFSCDEPGCSFEYRVWNPKMYEEIRPWTPVVKKTDVSWLQWRKGGPSDGLYRLYVRAVDPAGNRDLYYIDNANVYEWNYVSPPPLDIIFGVIAGFFGLLILAFIEQKRRERKRAMERYAMKRMRRKFKAMQQGDTTPGGQPVDWRVLYAESKEAGMLDGQRKKKKRKDGPKEKDKERRKRDKEKEKIKRKIRTATGGDKKSGSTSRSTVAVNVFQHAPERTTGVAAPRATTRGRTGIRNNKVFVDNTPEPQERGRERGGGGGGGERSRGGDSVGGRSREESKDRGRGDTKDRDRGGDRDNRSSEFSRIDPEKRPGYVKPGKDASDDKSQSPKRMKDYEVQGARGGGGEQKDGRDGEGAQRRGGGGGAQNPRRYKEYEEKEQGGGEHKKRD